MHTIYGETEFLLPMATGWLGQQFRPDARTMATANARGEVHGIVVFDNFSACDVFMHAVANPQGSPARWLSREFLPRVFAYPFIQCDMRRITAVIANRNARSLRFCRHIGFQVEGVCRWAFPDDDGVIMGMTRDQCRFIPKEFRHG